VLTGRWCAMNRQEAITHLLDAVCGEAAEYAMPDNAAKGSIEIGKEALRVLGVTDYELQAIEME
jgi:hypothetical protein